MLPLDESDDNDSLGVDNNDVNKSSDTHEVLMDTDEVTIIKKLASGALETTQCSFCGKMKTNHYCTAAVPKSNIFLETHGDNTHVCGKAMCIMCRNNWGDAEKYMIYCKDHHPNNKPKTNRKLEKQHL